MQHCFNVDLTMFDVVMSYQPKYSVETTLKRLLGLGSNKKQLESWIVIVNVTKVTRQYKCCLYHIFSIVLNKVGNDDTFFPEPAIEK